MKKFILCILLLTITIQAQTIDEAKKLFDETQQHKEAIEIFQKYPNDSEALYYLGKAYLYGMGVEKDAKKAFQYAQKSANQNNPSGLNLLGAAYQHGEAIEKDELQALMYYKQAAELGNTKAMINLASMYANVDSNIIQINYDESIKWLKRAIKLNNIDAIRILGNVLGSNQVAKHAEAIIYHKKYLELISTDNGKYTDVLWHLSRSYQKLNKHDIAYDYLKQAANLGDTWAIESIVYFENPNIIPKDELIYWMKQGVEKKIDTVYLPLYGYYLEKEDFESLKSFLEKAYYEDRNIDMGCKLASSYGSTPFFEINHEKAYYLASKIISENKPSKATESCYTTLSYLYRQGSYVAQDDNKSLELLKVVFYDINKEKNDLISKWIADYYLETLQDFQNAQKWYQITYDLTKDTKYLTKVDEYKKSLPVYEPLPQKALQELFPILDIFSKKEQVMTFLESEKYAFLSTNDKSIKMYDKSNLQLLKEFRAWNGDGILGAFLQMAYDENSHLLYASTLNSDKDVSQNDNILVFDIETGQIIKIINNKKAMKNTYLTISNDGKYLAAINSENLLNITDTKSDEIQHYELNSQGKFTKAKVEKIDDDYLVHLLSSKNELLTFSTKQKRRIDKKSFVTQAFFRKEFKNTVNHSSNALEKIFKHKPFDFKNIYLSAKTLDIKAEKTSLNFNLNTLTFAESENFKANQRAISKIKITPKYNNRVLEVYDENDKLLSKISLLYVNAIKYEVLENKYILVVTSDLTQMLLFTLEGRPIANLQGIKALQTNISYSDGLITSFGDDNVIHIFDLRDLEKYSKKEKKYNKETIQGFANLFGEDPINFLKEIDDDFITHMVKTGQFNFGFTPTVKQVKDYFDMLMLEKEEVKSLASLYIKNDKEWILYTPEGLFTYGGEGYKLLKYHQNQGLHKEAKIIENEKLFDKFYRPDLIKKILAGEKIDIPMDVKAVILNIKPPELHILSNQMISKKDIDLIYKVCDAGDGIADPKLLINGQAINPPSSRGFTIQKIETKEDKCKVYRSSHTLSPGENIISLKAYDKDKTIASESAVIKVMADYKVEEKPNLYFLSIAVSDYKDDSFDLKYPVSDAIKVKEKIEQKSKSIYENIYAYEIHEKDVNLENINKTFDEIKSKISKNDAFILYIAGHGISKDSIYHFIPYDQAEKISIYEIKTNLSKLENDKSLVLLDTCQSGAAIDSMVDEVTTVNRLSHDDNRNYIVASSKNQVALEGYKDHGVFTYGVLDAFINNDKLKVWGLADHISEIVPKITQEKFHFSQKPQAKLNQNFILIEGEN